MFEVEIKMLFHETERIWISIVYLIGGKDSGGIKTGYLIAG